MSASSFRMRIEMGALWLRSFIMILKKGATPFGLTQRDSGADPTGLVKLKSRFKDTHQCVLSRCVALSVQTCRQ